MGRPRPRRATRLLACPKRPAKFASASPAGPIRHGAVTFYPVGWPQKRELEYASRQVNSIEVNGSFYSLQTPKSYQRWYESTPDGFIFSVKAPRFITHIRRLNRCSDAAGEFLLHQACFASKRSLGHSSHGNSLQVFGLATQRSRKHSSNNCPRIPRRLRSWRAVTTTNSADALPSADRQDSPLAPRDGSGAIAPSGMPRTRSGNFASIPRRAGRRQIRRENGRSWKMSPAISSTSGFTAMKNSMPWLYRKGHSSSKWATKIDHWLTELLRHARHSNGTVATKPHQQTGGLRCLHLLRQRCEGARAI